MRVFDMRTLPRNNDLNEYVCLCACVQCSVRAHVSPPHVVVSDSHVYPNTPSFTGKRAHTCWLKISNRQ